MARLRILPLVALMGLGSVLSLGTPAAYGAGASSPAESIMASVASGPFQIQVSAHRAADAPATASKGSFVAHFEVGGTDLFTLRGPVTCLDVVGDQAGLFYPITSSDPSIFAATDAGVFIYLDTDASGKAKSVGFLPVPFHSVKSCKPSLALLPVTSGNATLVS
jgi:hypothetical protein